MESIDGAAIVAVLVVALIFAVIGIRKRRKP